MRLLLRCCLPACHQSVGNLRSAVAKNALLTLGDLWAGLGKAMDAELPVVAPVLLKRFSDTQGFLGEVGIMDTHPQAGRQASGRADEAVIIRGVCLCVWLCVCCCRWRSL